MARRTRAERDRARVLGWWAAIILLGWFAWDFGRLGLWLLPFLAWAHYQLCAAPKLRGVETSKGHPCKNGRTDDYRDRGNGHTDTAGRLTAAWPYHRGDNYLGYPNG
jgi:hypothetical protein